MDATDIIVRVAKAIERQGLETVMIGNAAAAMQGAPVTTLDIDFLYRPVPASRRKLKRIAGEVGGAMFATFYPPSTMIRRWIGEEETNHIDFLTSAAGIPSFDRLRECASEMTLRGVSIRVATLADVIRMKRADNRPKDRALLYVLEKTLRPPKWTSPRRQKSLRAQNEWLENDMIRRRLAAPLEHRMNFLRRRVGICSSAL